MEKYIQIVINLECYQFIIKNKNKKIHMNHIRLFKIHNLSIT
jgi:hypothetical protein